ncbi:MAG TPA: hypothetical protein VIG51_04040 [Candidatus Baltobacteraceae bacterium]|jgi:lipopolysaccharide assembly outer membrane protein LptD (OstA)
MKRLVPGLLLAGLLALVAASPSPPHRAQIGEWTMATSELDTNLQSGDFSAPHHVTLSRADGSTVDADRGTGNYKKRYFQLFGSVSVHDQSGTFGGLNSMRQNTRGPATLTCDRLTIDSASKLYHATGDVRYKQDTTTADANDARLNDLSHRLDLQGQVHIVQGDRTLDAKSATYNTLSDDGEASGDVKMLFPGMINASIATPRPIKIKTPKIPH